MADYDTDEAREFRRNRLVRVKPLGAELSLPEREFRTTYMRYQVVSRERMADVEEDKRVMFCPACQQPYGPKMVKVRILHVGYTEDHLRNYPAIAEVHCQGCEWEELIPVVAPVVTEEDRTLVSRFKRVSPIRAGFAAGGSGGGITNQAFGEAFLNEIKLGEPVYVPGTPRVGQGLANAVWLQFAADDETLRGAENARSQIEAIERAEAGMRAALVMRNNTDAALVAKVAQMGSMYGVGQFAADDETLKYARKLHDQLAKRLIK